MYISTYWMNVIVIWTMFAILFIALYFRWLHKVLIFGEKLSDKIKKGKG